MVAITIPKMAAAEVSVKNQLPSISIIMPVRNESSLIARSLGGVLAQDYPHDSMEILLVDGRSDDGTLAAIKSVIARSDRSANSAGPSIRILDNPQRVVPAALNIGLEHATGDVIFRLDGHSEMAPGYLRKCVAKLMERKEVACVAGPSVAIGSGVLGEAYAMALRTPFGVGGGTFRTRRNEAYVDTLAFGCYRREVFDEVGKFDPDLNRNQDIEFNTRLRKAGYKLLLIGDTNTYYHAPGAVGSILRQCFNNGFWNTRELGKMVGVLSWRHFIPAIFVSSLLVSAAAALISPWGGYLFLLTSFSYVTAALLITIASLLESKNAISLLLPPVFGLMHLSYGIGSLTGLFRFVTKGGQPSAQASK